MTLVMSRRRFLDLLLLVLDGGDEGGVDGGSTVHEEGSMDEEDLVFEDGETTLK